MTTAAHILLPILLSFRIATTHGRALTEATDREGFDWECALDGATCGGDEAVCGDAEFVSGSPGYLRLTADERWENGHIMLPSRDDDLPLLWFTVTMHYWFGSEDRTTNAGANGADGLGISYLPCPAVAPACSPLTAAS